VGWKLELSSVDSPVCTASSGLFASVIFGFLNLFNDQNPPFPAGFGHCLLSTQ
jgi:hypothetical protein